MGFGNTGRKQNSRARGSNPMGITSIQLDPSVLQTRFTKIPSATLLTLFSAPGPVVVPAPPSGYINVFLDAYGIMKAGGAAYTDGGGGALTINYKSDGSGSAVSTSLTASASDLLATASTTGMFTWKQLTTDVKSGTLADFNAQPLVIKKATADLAAGTGVLYLWVQYVTLPINF